MLCQPINDLSLIFTGWRLSGLILTANTGQGYAFMTHDPTEWGSLVSQAGLLGPLLGQCGHAGELACQIEQIVVLTTADHANLRIAPQTLNPGIDDNAQATV